MLGYANDYGWNSLFWSLTLKNIIVELIFAQYKFVFVATSYQYNDVLTISIMWIKLMYAPLKNIFTFIEMCSLILFFAYVFDIISFM